MELIVYRGERHFIDEHGRGVGQADALAFYQGAKPGHEDTLIFGVEESELSDAGALVGSLAHEVAHAVRDDLGVIVANEETEERLTDVTTICLGFGVPLLNSSYQFLTGHHDQHGQQLLWERKSRGYLSPGQLTWLLATQLVARGKDAEEVKAVSAALEEGHRSRLGEALDLIEETPEELRHSLGLSEELPQRSELFVGTLATVPCRIIRPEDEWRAAPPQDIVFRVRHDWALGVGIIGAGITAAVAIRLGAGGFGWLIGVVGFFPARWLGSLQCSYRCASCSDFLAPTAEICSTCHAKIVGEIPRRKDRLAAEERYWGEQQGEGR